MSNVFEIIHRPADLEGYAAKVWDENALRLCRLGTLTLETRPLLAELCQLAARMDELNAFLAEHGLTYRRGRRECRRKEAREWSRVMSRMALLFNRLGMTPRGYAELQRKGKLRPFGRMPEKRARIASGGRTRPDKPNDAA